MPETQIETEALEGLKKAVHDLAEGVESMKEGLVDKETVESIAKATVEAQLTANAGLRRRNGPMPSESDDEGDGGDGGDGAAAVGLAQKVLAEGGPSRLHYLQTGRIDRGNRSPLIVPPERIAKQAKVSVESLEEYREMATSVAIIDAFCEAYGGRGGPLPESVRETTLYRDEFMPLVQAMDTATAAEGIEYVPKELSGNLIDRISLELRVVPLFRMAEMPTNPWDIPGRAVARVRLAKAVEQTADTGQTGFTKVTPGTRKVTLTAVKFAGESLTSKELEEDSLIAILPFIQDELVDYMSADWEDATINGDSAGTQDSDSGGATDIRRNWDGLRKLTQAGAKTDIANVAPTVLNSIRATRKKMGKYAVRPGSLAHVCSISAYMQLLNDTNVLTLEKYGPQATILAGELGSVDGTPLIVSEYVRADLNATGVFDGVTTNRTEIVTVSRAAFMFGNRRALTVQVLRELFAEFDQDAIICSHRKAFASLYPTSQLTVGFAFNIAS